MAGAAVFAGYLVIARLALGDPSVVAGIAPAGRIAVADPIIEPIAGARVAVLTNAGSQRVSCRLAICTGAIVAAGTVGTDATVAKGCRSPRGGPMAGAAI